MGRGAQAALVMVSACGAGCIIGATQTADPFLLSLWVNLGTAMLLFSALYLVERLVLERRVASAKSEIDASATAAVAAVQTKLAVSIENLQEAFEAHRSQVDERDLALLSAARSSASAGSIGALLARARELSVVTEAGPRAEVPGQYERLRFRPPDLDGTIVVTVEELDGTPIGEVEWRLTDTAVQVFAAVTSLLQREGRFETGGWFDPSRILDQLVRTLDVAIGARTGRGGGPPDLGKVIEIPVATWAITDNGVEAIGRHHYSIARWRVHEADWHIHMASKPWVVEDDFHWALTIGRELFPEEEPV